MCRGPKTFLLCGSIILHACALLLSETTVWMNGTGNRDWASLSNWSVRVPLIVDTVSIGSAVQSPIIHRGTQNANIIKIGDTGTGKAFLYINANTILNVGSSCSVGYETDGILNLNGGDLDIVLGTSDIYGYLIVGGINGGNGIVEITGGLIQAYDVMVGCYSGTGTINLYSGTMDIVKPDGGLTITSRGLINIQDGFLLLDGNQTGYCSDHIHAGKIIAYNGSGTVLTDYNNLNPGKTTVWAMDSSLPADFDRSKKIDLPDLTFLASNWLEEDLQVKPMGDLNGDSEVNCIDLSKFSSGWKSRKKIECKRFIGPDDCPGVVQFADPYVFQEGDAWFITSTYTVGQPVYMFSTVNFIDKSRYTLSLDLNESYLRNHFNNPGLIPYHVWGFVPYKHTDGSWHAYGTVHIGGYQTFVCHFSPDGSSMWPVTDWLLDKVMVGSPSNIAYESKVYSDASGMYLLYVGTLADGNNHVMAHKLLAPDELDPLFTARAVLSPEGLRSEDRNPPGGMQICEGQNISHVFTSSGSKYVMFYAVGDFAESNYKLGVAYSDVLIPSAGQQYIKPKSFDSENVWGNPGPRDEVLYMLQTQIADWPNYCGSLLNGPGLGNLIEYLDNYYVVFHARDMGQAGTGAGRWVWICPVTIDFGLALQSWVVPQLPY